MKIREEFHHLIDSIGNEDTLKAYYQLIHDLNDEQAINPWDKLNSEQQQMVLSSYEDSLNGKNLVAHEDVMKKYAKWLG